MSLPDHRDHRCLCKSQEIPGLTDLSIKEQSDKRQAGRHLPVPTQKSHSFQENTLLGKPAVSPAAVLQTVRRWSCQLAAFLHERRAAAVLEPSSAGRTRAGSETASASAGYGWLGSTGQPSACT